MRREPEPGIAGLLPLPPAVLHILISLGEDERHGYSIMQEVADRTGGQVRMSPGTLYGSIKRMLADGLIEERTLSSRPRTAAGVPRPAAGHEERRRVYRMTAYGRRVAAAEADRLSSLLAQARTSGLVPRRS